MKKTKKVRIAAISLAMVSACAVTAFAAGYDSAADPLVSLSYIEGVVMPGINSRIDSLSSSVSSMQDKVNSVSGAVGEIDSLKNRITALENGAGSGLPDDAKERLEALESGSASLSGRLDAAESAIQNIIDSGNTVYDDYSYQTVHVSKSNSILITDTTMDIIMKSGSASAYVQDSGEVFDLTGDSVLVNEAEIKTDHAVIIKNSGVRITSDEAYFLVRGDYRIVQQ